MSNTTLIKHRDIRPINDVAATEALLALLVAMSPEQQQELWLKSEQVGYVCVFQHESQPGKIVEYVQGSQGDSVSTLYEGSGKLADLESLAAIRQELMSEIGALTTRLPSTIAVFDGGRGRQAALKELGTAQLMDVVAHFSGTDIRTI